MTFFLMGWNCEAPTKCEWRTDRKKEELRQILRNGHVDIDSVMRSLDSGGFANKYRRLKWDEPSHTLVAHMARRILQLYPPQILTALFRSGRQPAFNRSQTDTVFRNWRIPAVPRNRKCRSTSPG